MANLNESLTEAVCIEEEVFFGPITDKERKIRERLEALHRNELKVDSNKAVDEDESQNNSVYKSFSVDESKYDSFDDSLNESVDKIFQEAKPIALRKSYDKLKPKRSGFYDSLEDVRSLVSNIDKCSISCEVENDTNLNSRHFIEDSLKVPSVPVANNNNFTSDQIHFDDDSLAILECETTFSDSLEEVNMMESIEIEEINDIENIIIENQNVALTVDQVSACAPRNLFDTSVEVICEKKNEIDTADQESSSGDKNLLYDSLSNSDFKDILTDSLEEGKQSKEIRSLLKYATINKTDLKENLKGCQNIPCNVEYNSLLPQSNSCDTSVQIVSGKQMHSNGAQSRESFNDKYLLEDSFSNSEAKDISKDSLNESDMSNKLIRASQNSTEIMKTDDIYQKQNTLDNSVPIISAKQVHSNGASSSKSLTVKHLLHDSFSNSETKDISKDSLNESDLSNKIIRASQTGKNVIKTEDIEKENTLDSSIQILSEKQKHNNDSVFKGSLNDKHLLNDSFSNSEVKDISKDSLNESDTSNKIIRDSQINTHDIKSENIYPKQSTLDNSVQIIGEKEMHSNDVASEKSFNDKHSYNSFPNSKTKDISKDSLDESGMSDTIVKASQHNIDVMESEDVYQNQNTFDTSVQIVYDSSQYHKKKEIPGKIDTLKKNFTNDKVIQAKPTEQINVQSFTCKSSCLPEKSLENLKSIDKNEIDSEYHSNTMNKILQDFSLNTEPTVNASNNASDIQKETFSIESCQLEILNDDINNDKDLKFQLHLEVTVGDKKCQIASQDLKILPVISPNSKSETDSISTMSVVNPFIKQKENFLNSPELNSKNKGCDIFGTHSPRDSSYSKTETAFASNVTQRVKSSSSRTSCSKFSCAESFHDLSLLQALDLPDLSRSILNESIIQSEDSLMPLNLYSPDDCIQNFHATHFKNKNKENIPEDMQFFESKGCVKSQSSSPSKAYNSKTPQSLKKCSSLKENKKASATKIPVRKVDNFVAPTPTPIKFTKPVPTTHSTEKLRKCHHSPHFPDSGKKNPGTASNKIPHICKVRNTIFSKVPQIVTPKKYINIQSPVAQYIKNNGPVKTHGTDPVLRDCMNRLAESPAHLHQAAGTSSKLSKKKV